MQKRGLGRGLESLIPGLTQDMDLPLIISGDTRAALQYLQVTKIVPNPNQPRRYFDEGAFSELVCSVKEHGLVQPVVVRQTGSLFELIAGERRWRAAKEAGLDVVPAIIKNTSDREALEIALIENIQRENLNALEEAAAYYHLIEDFDLSQEQVAQKVGKNRSTIGNTVRLLQLPEQVKALVVEGKISAGHARAILAVEGEEARLRLAERVVRDTLSVRQVEAMAALWKKEPQKEAVPATPLHYKRAAKDLSRRLSAKVKIKTQGEKGRLEIHFGTEDELRQIISRLSGDDLESVVL